ncbi:hypothetical protein [Streptomyces sioyaensis]|uniref:hypothetical protein n=1 Tax=Streptomyces sioyaensis TaxID=67364 RepID=UPI003D7211E3
MATQQELDDAVVAAAQQLAQQISLMDQAESRRVGYKILRDEAETNRAAAAADVRRLRDQVKAGATRLNDAIVAANAGPTS